MTTDLEGNKMIHFITVPELSIETDAAPGGMVPDKAFRCKLSWLGLAGTGCASRRWRWGGRVEAGMM